MGITQLIDCKGTHMSEVNGSHAVDPSGETDASYAEEAGLRYEGNEVTPDEDVALTEEGFEDVPAFEGTEEVLPAVDGVPHEVAVEEQQAHEKAVEEENKEEEEEGFLESLVDDSSLPEHVKEVLNMDVADAFHELFGKDEKKN